MADLFEPSWRRLWQGLEASGDGLALRDVLLDRYGEPGRHYHARQHLDECLQHFDRTIAFAASPAEVEAALWFHDAIYDPTRHDNETLSARWAAEASDSAAVAAPRIQHVVALILATRHGDDSANMETSGADAALLVDIDLSILGATPERFAQYEAQIRREYAFVPDEIYAVRRRAVLGHFARRDPLLSLIHI